MLLRSSSFNALGVMFRLQDNDNNGGYEWNQQNSYFDDVLVENLAPIPLNNLPTVTITAPAGGTSYEEGESVLLEVTASDLEDGDMSSQVDWSSSLDGVLGMGSMLTVDTLNPGQHTITASVTDSGGDTETAAITLTVSGGGPSILLTDDFNDGDSAGWSIVDNGTTGGPAAWDVTAGELRQTSNSYGGYLYSWYLPIRGTYARWDGGLTWTDYQLDVTLRGSDDDGIGVMFRVQDNDNYYRFEMDRQRGFRRLVKKVNGSFTLLYSDSVAYALNQDYSVTVTAQGSTLSVAVDGQVIFTGTDTSHTQGTVALYNYGEQNAYYDDVVVTSLAGVAVVSPLWLEHPLLAGSSPGGSPPWPWPPVWKSAAAGGE